MTKNQQNAIDAIYIMRNTATIIDTFEKMGFCVEDNGITTTGGQLYESMTRAADIVLRECGVNHQHKEFDHATNDVMNFTRAMSIPMTNETVVTFLNELTTKYKTAD